MKKTPPFRDELSLLVQAWDVLPVGHVPAKHVERWLEEHMAPAIKKARIALKKTSLTKTALDQNRHER